MQPTRIEAVPVTERRRHRRHRVNGTVEFGYPGPDGHACRMDLHDLSAGGVSFVLAHDLPGLEFGSIIRHALLRVRLRSVRADLLVIHVTQGLEPGSLCGCLVYPASDRDLVHLKAILEALEHHTGTCIQ